jgi:hypothetical protein
MINRLVNGKLEALPLNIENSELREWGVGLELFFELVKKLAMCFFVAGIFSIGAIYSNY